MRKYFQDIMMIALISFVAAALLALVNNGRRYAENEFDGCSRTNITYDAQGNEGRSIYGWHHWNCWKKDKDAPTAEEQAKYDAEMEEHYKRMASFSVRKKCDNGLQRHIRIETIDDQTGKVVTTSDECLWFGARK